MREGVVANVDWIASGSGRSNLQGTCTRSFTAKLPVFVQIGYAHC